MVNIKVPVVENRQYPNDSLILAVRAPEIAQSVVPGQFVMVAAADRGTAPAPLLKRALAVYSVHTEDGHPSIVTFLVKIVGEGTQRLNSLRPGELIDLVGPLGNGFDLNRGKGRINFLVVGGTGVASVYLLAETWYRRGEEVHLVYGGRSANYLIGLNDFKKLGIPTFVTTEDGSLGHRGLVTEGFQEYLGQFPAEHSNICTCGPNAMMEAVTAVAESRGIPCQISVESKMACGFGVCLGCTVKTLDSYRLACTHGPVFDGDRFVWENGSAGKKNAS